MKKSKKLMVAALGALAAGTAAAGGVSTFAWFASNYTVDATGMKIKASTNEVYLQINTKNAWNDGNTDYRSATAPVAQDTLSPVHAVSKWEETKAKNKLDDTTSGQEGMTSYKSGDKKIPSWIYGTAASSTSATIDSNGYTDKTSIANTVSTTDSTSGDVTTEGKNGYTLLNKFYLRLRPVESGTQPSVDILTASVAWAESPKDNIAKSVRVLIWNATDNIGAIYTPRDLTSWAENTTDLLPDTKEMEGATASPYNARELSVYVYFDGEDTNCYTENVETDNSYSVKVTFSASNSSSNN